MVISSVISAPGNWRLALRPGAVIGIYNTGSGMVLLAFQSAKTRKRMIREHRLVKGEKKIPEAAFIKMLDGVRQAGCTRGPSRTITGVMNLSFPILDPSGNAIAALTCPFIQRIDGYKAPSIDAVAKLFGETAKDIQRKISGY